MKFLLFILFPVLSNAQAVKIDLKAQIFPELSQLKCEAEIQDDFKNGKVFFLNKNLKIEKTQGAQIKELSEKELSSLGLDYSDRSLAKAYLIKSKSPKAKIFYFGEINSGLKEVAQEYSRGFSETEGIISSSGVYLSGSSFFYPYFENSLLTFKAEIIMPDSFSCVSSGERLKKEKGKEIWKETSPVDEITLSCSKFKEYSLKDKDKIFYVFLLKEDEDLAKKYLETAKTYVNFYSSLIGPYPYKKFALVENFWETGYGLPSFTLLGSKVIRLPFIVSSSYPHEILHNWFGNGIFVDYSSGNWCEGLTVYTADYLIKDNKGKGREYRRDILKKYSDYVKKDKDFPLKDFISRHSSAQEAVGYGKSMMFYHMLRNKIGGEKFIKALKDFYSSNLFKKTSFEDLRKSFEKTSKSDLKTFFDQWINKPGALELVLDKAEISKYKDLWRLDFSVYQKGNIVYESVKMPVEIIFEKEIVKKYLDLSSSSVSFSFVFREKPSALAIDPDYELFRKLSPLETPPSLYGILGAEKPNIILPCSSQNIENYESLAKNWNLDKNNMPAIRKDCSLSAPASDYSSWYFGRENKFYPLISGYLGQYAASLDEKYFFDGKDSYEISGKTLVFAFYDHFNSNLTAAYLISDSPDSLKSAAAKLPHYGKYSWLIFDEKGTIYKTGIWEKEISPLRKDFSEKQFKKIKNYSPLAEIPSFLDKSAVKNHIYKLSGEIKERFPSSKGFEEAAKYVISVINKKLKPLYKNYRQDFSFEYENKKIYTYNIIGKIDGKKNKDEYVLLCAHLDHLKSEQSKSYPGANDNASGAALLLELASYYSKNPTDRTLIFAFFSAEEEGRKGSQEFIKNFSEKEKINAVLNFDNIGRLKGRKITILNSSSSDKWRHIFRGAGFITQNEYDLSSQDLDSSDQISFIENGIPAVQFFDGGDLNYHKPSDTPDNIDYQGMANIAETAKEAIDYLASSSDFITRPQKTKDSEQNHSKSRKVSTGIMPDFSYEGKGIKVQEVSPSSPMDKAGIMPGDIIKSLNGEEITDLKNYSQKLKEFSPGEKVRIEYISQGKTKTAEILLEGKK
ncbi:MAG: M28 family peptidase [Elusimicrobia bacterium]|nr:M28 family peptidase [Elusimicrobiota bacterium]